MKSRNNGQPVLVGRSFSVFDLIKPDEPMLQQRMYCNHRDSGTGSMLDLLRTMRNPHQSDSAPNSPGREDSPQGSAGTLNL